MLGGLDDHHGPGKAGYDAVSGRESPCQGRLSQIVLGDQGPLASDRLEEAPVASWVDDGVSIGVEMASLRMPSTSMVSSTCTRTRMRSILCIWWRSSPVSSSSSSETIPA